MADGEPQKRDVVNMTNGSVGVTISTTLNGTKKQEQFTVPPRGMVHDQIVAHLEALGFPPDPDLLFKAPHFEALTKGPHQHLRAQPSRS